MTQMTNLKHSTFYSQTFWISMPRLRQLEYRRNHLRGSPSQYVRRWTEETGSFGSTDATPLLLPGRYTRLSGTVWFSYSAMLSLRISIVCCSRSLIHRLCGIHSSWLPALQYTQITHFPERVGEHLVETSARFFNPVVKLVLENQPFLMPEPAEKPSLNSFSTGSDPTSVADNLNSHFASVSCNTIAPASLSSVSSPATPTSTSMPVLSLTLTTPEWCDQALSKLKPRCATGLDQLPPSALIAGRSIICFPLSSIINSSISSSNFPCQWKCASICPLHKGGDREKATNYRPISILPATSKLMEKHVQLQLSSHLNSNSLLFPLQSGFRPSHSTQTLLLHCLDR